MQILKSFFGSISKAIHYINTYFKTFVFLFIVLLILMPSSDSKSSSSFANLQRIDLKGEIFNSQMVLEKIIQAKNNNDIKGVLFVIDSPGGAFAPSMELALAIKDLKEKKPVVAYAAGTMASGSYLSGVSANEIVSNPASFIGSIGVIMQGADLSDLASKLGIKAQTIKAGDFKEAGTFTRPWSKEEKDYLQDLIQKSYVLFTDFVAKERKLKLEQSDDWANARVFLPNEAKKLGLIDEIGNFEFAQKRLEELSGVKNPVWMKENKIDKFLDQFAAQSSSFIAEILNKVFLNTSLKERF